MTNPTQGTIRMTKMEEHPMIEKMARAALRDELAATKSARDFETVWAEEGAAYLANAQSFLNVLAEPDEAMIEAGRPHAGVSAGSARRTFTAMIQAASNPINSREGE